jgi:hypothetical protein
LQRIALECPNLPVQEQIAIVAQQLNLDPAELQISQTIQ